VGLAARDSLRFEPGFPLYGHELTEEVTPVEARLKWACATDKDFIGKPVIERQIQEGTRRRLVTLRLIDKGVPRQGSTVLNEQEEQIGETVTGMYAPTVDAYCANAYVEAGYRKSGTPLLVQIRNRTKRAEVVKRPLYKPAYRS
jgi:glycine cleavage system aminomethyltransferase T